MKNSKGTYNINNALFQNKPINEHDEVIIVLEKEELLELITNPVQTVNLLKNYSFSELEYLFNKIQEGIS